MVELEVIEVALVLVELVVLVMPDVLVLLVELDMLEAVELEELLVEPENQTDTQRCMMLDISGVVAL